MSHGPGAGSILAHFRQQGLVVGIKVDQGVEPISPGGVWCCAVSTTPSMTLRGLLQSCHKHWARANGQAARGTDVAGSGPSDGKPLFKANYSY